MGMGGISIWQLLIVLVIVLLLFGTKRLRNIGSDLGGAVKGFRSAMGDASKGDDDESKQLEENKAERTADGDAGASSSSGSGTDSGADKSKV